MEPVGLALSVFCTLKEVYLLSKFVIRIASYAIKHQLEKARLHIRLRHEFLFLKSFGTFLTEKGYKLVDDSQLDRDWLKHVGNIIEQLRIAYSDYAKLAAAEDDEYKHFSPYYPSNTILSHSIDFSLDIEESPMRIAAAEGHVGRISRIVEYARESKQCDWKWALFQKRRLEDVLTDLRLWNAMLKELVPITIATKMSTNQQMNYCENASEEDKGRLGLGLHTQLQKLSTEDHVDDLAGYLHDVSLESPEATSIMPLSYGILSSNENLRENVLIEYKPIAERFTRAVGDKVKQAQALSHANAEAVRLAGLLRLAGNSELCTLPFIGYIERKNMDPPQHAFLFRYPEKALEQSPILLHDMLSSDGHDLSLEARFAISKRVATSLWMLHADNWVHKSIRSQSIVFFFEQGGKVTLKDPYLVNFEYSRPASQNTTWTGDDDEEKNLYRHPDRQGLPTKSFDKTHDAYALGIVLLEIGLLQTASKIRERAKQTGTKGRFDRYMLRETFITLAKQDLPQTMGLAYRDAVLTCLMGDFACKVQGGKFGMEFYEKVVQRLDIRRLWSSGRTQSGLD